jgi:hypothetical protein
VNALGTRLRHHLTPLDDCLDTHGQVWHAPTCRISRNVSADHRGLEAGLVVTETRPLQG